MSRGVLTMRSTDTVYQAAREMSVAAIRHMPIVDAHGKVVGIVSSHDLIAALAQHDDAELGRVMTTVVHTVSPGARADDAAGMMIDLKVNALPVVAKNGELVGIITATDFLAVAHQVLGGQAVEREVGEV